MTAPPADGTLAAALARRRMVRAYRPDPVDGAVLRRILDRARRAPSAGHTQAVTFHVLTSADARRAVAEACGEPAFVARGFAPWLSVAPVHVLVAVEPDRYHRRYAEPDKAGSTPPARWEAPFWWVDAGAALMLLLLAVADEGLAAGFLAVRREQVAARFRLEDGQLPVGLVTIGHPAPDPREGSRRRGRRPYDDQVRVVD